MPGANAVSPIDLRQSQRYPTHIEGIGIFNGVRYPIVIADISSEGALIRGLPLLPLGGRVVVQARSLDVGAIVVRSTARGIGVRLQATIEPLSVVRENYAGLEHLRRTHVLPKSLPGRSL